MDKEERIGISKKDFNNKDKMFWRCYGDTQKLVLSFLRKHKERAFTTKEMEMLTDCSRTRISHSLTRLHKKKLVLHRSPYWTLNDEEDIEK